MIVLLTDFGYGEYVGVMKGVISVVNPEARIIDLCHTICPQCLIEASWVLRSNCNYFPKGSVFCCVVDPGVGTSRKAIAVRTTDYDFVAPDNGLLWETLRNQEALAIRQIAVPAGASRTFHGRDIFARAAAQIALGQFDELGELVADIEPFELHRNGREGIAVRIDRFGNIVTNLPPLERSRYTVTFEKREQSLPFFGTYDEAPADELFLITGSNETLEISLKGGDATTGLNVTPGQKITIA
jgi:S-adenosylmethionine hydrolase